jgi:hypothetical protein
MESWLEERPRREESASINSAAGEAFISVKSTATKNLTGCDLVGGAVRSWERSVGMADMTD